MYPSREGSLTGAFLFVKVCPPLVRSIPIRSLRTEWSQRVNGASVTVIPLGGAIADAFENR